MPGTMSHNPGNVVCQLLIDLDIGTDPVDEDEWSVYTTQEPDKPDDCITVYDTVGIESGRTTPDGERSEHPGIQVRVSGTTYTKGFVKANEIARAFDNLVRQTIVNIANADDTENQYKVQTIIRKGTIIPLGRDKPTSRLSVFTINALVSVRQLV